MATTTQDTREKIIVPGPAGFHPPSAAQLGVALPDPGEGLFYGLLEPNEEKVIEEMARKMLTSPNATIFPGPLLLWAWNEHAMEKAKATLEIAAQIPEVMIIPMPDYRPKYPKIDPEEVINPNHPNLTIWGNKIEACIFIGVHCHYANLTLKMIRAGTNCCTMAICAEQGHEDAMLTIRDSDTLKNQAGRPNFQESARGNGHQAACGRGERPVYWYAIESPRREDPYESDDVCSNPRRGWQRGGVRSFP